MKIRNYFLKSLLIAAMTLSYAEAIDIGSADDARTALTNGTQEDLTFNFTSGYFSEGFTTDDDITVENWVLTNGSSGMQYIFTGSVSGSGNIGFDWAQQDPKNQTFQFEGSMSGFTGNISTASLANYKLIFAGTARDNISGTGAINFLNVYSTAENDGSINYAASGGSTGIYNSSIQGKILNFSSGGSTGSRYFVYSLLNVTQTLNVSESSTVFFAHSGAPNTLAAVHVEAGSTLRMEEGTTSISGALSGGGTYAVGERATLELNGTLSSILNVENAGTMDLSGLTIDSASFGITGAGTFDLFNGTLGSVTGTDSWTFTDFNTTGYTTSFDAATGELIVSLAGAGYSFGTDGASGQTLDWSATGGDLGGFADGSNITLSGETVAILSSDIQANRIALNDGASLTVEGGGYDLSAELVSLGAGASMSVAYDDLDVTGGAIVLNSESTTSQFSLDGGASAVTLASTLDLSDYAGNLELSNGTFTVGSTGFANVQTVTLHDDTSLQLGAVSTQNNVIEIAGESGISISGAGAATDLATLSGSGSVTLSNLELTGDVTFTGTINVTGSGEVRFGTGINTTPTLAASVIHINADATFALSRNGGDFTGTDIMLTDGGRLYTYNTSAQPDADRSSGFQFGTLSVEGVGKVETQWKGLFTFEELTGSGDLNFIARNSANEHAYFELAGVTDYNGSVLFQNGDAATDHLQFSGTISQQSGVSMSVSSTGGVVRVLDAVFVGDGSVTFESNIELKGLNTLQSGTLSVESFDFASVDSRLDVTGGRLNFTGSEIDSGVDGILRVGAATVGATVNVTVADDIQLGLSANPLGRSSTPVTTVLDSTDAEITFTGVLSDADGSVGALSVMGAHGVILSGDNTYSGGTTVQAASNLQLGSNKAAGTGAITLESDATLTITDGLTIANDIEAIASANLAVLADTTVTFTGAITAADGAQIILDAGNYVFDGARVDMTALVTDAASSVTFKNSTLTEIAVAGPTTISFTTTEAAANGSGAADISSYTITGLAVMFAQTLEGTLTLDLGTLTGFEEEGITAFLLDDVGDIHLNYQNINLIINGETYGVLGANTNGVEGGDYYLYIPEPSTATLSLLALTALVARRRRKQAV